MFFYILYQLSGDCDDDNYGARNARIFLFGSMFYIILHAILFSPGHYLSEYSGYFYYAVLFDVIAVSIIYKLYYNAPIIRELNVFAENPDVGQNDENAPAAREPSVFIKNSNSEIGDHDVESRLQNENNQTNPQHDINDTLDDG